MSAPIFLGDEVAGAGFRLAGADVRTPLPGGERDALALARREAPMVIVSMGVARGIPDEELRAALSAIAPLVVLVPDLAGGVGLPDLVAEVRGQLGLVDE